MMVSGDSLAALSGPMSRHARLVLCHVHRIHRPERLHTAGHDLYGPRGVLATKCVPPLNMTLATRVHDAGPSSAAALYNACSAQQLPAMRSRSSTRTAAPRRPRACASAAATIAPAPPPPTKHPRRTPRGLPICHRCDPPVGCSLEGVFPEDMPRQSKPAPPRPTLPPVADERPCML